MKIAIIGLPNCGKSTVFNALTRGNAETSSFSSGRLEPNLAVVKVPDPRLESLRRIYNPKKLTPAEVQYVDVRGIESGEGRSKGLPPELLTLIGSADAFLHVVRSFEDPAVVHPEDTIDPVRDIENVELELILNDLSVVERRLERLAKDLRKKTGNEKQLGLAEEKVLGKIREHLEGERPLRALELSPGEEKLIRGFQFLSAKPMLIVFNTGEGEIGKDPDFRPAEGTLATSMSAKLEAELAQLDDEDAEEFMADLGLATPARDRVIALSYRLLGLISFLTVGEDEVRAWTIRRGTTAVQAGGVIHSDIERGFIRAEVVEYDRLVSAGSLAAARKQGELRLEGREYIVQDGDISHFLFNV